MLEEAHSTKGDCSCTAHWVADNVSWFDFGKVTNCICYGRFKSRADEWSDVTSAVEIDMATVSQRYCDPNFFPNYVSIEHDIVSDHIRLREVILKRRRNLPTSHFAKNLTGKSFNEYWLKDVLSAPRTRAPKCWCINVEWEQFLLCRTLR